MRTLTSTVIALATTFLVLQSQAAPSGKNPLTRKEWLALKEVSRDEIKTTFKTFLKEASNNTLPMPITLLPTINKVEKFCEHPFIEADTGFQLKWLETVRDGMKAVMDIQTKKRMCRISGNKKAYTEINARFDMVRGKLERLMKHPVPVDPKRLQALRKKARVVRMALRKKLDDAGWEPPATATPDRTSDASKPTKKKREDGKKSKSQRSKRNTTLGKH